MMDERMFNQMKSRKFNRTHRLFDADPELFQAFPYYERGVQKYNQPMVISELQKTRLLNSNLDPQLLEEINNGVTYRGNHYFSPRHFCYQCDVSFLLGDTNHTNHITYYANIDGYRPYVGYYTGRYSNNNTHFLAPPCMFKSKSKHTKFVNHVKKYIKKYMKSDRFITMYCVVALGCNIMIVNALLPHVVERRMLAFRKT